MTTTCTPARQKRYHRSASLLWQAALRRLVGKGLTDSRVADLLSGLDEAAMRQLDREGWHLETVEDMWRPNVCPLPWTARSVGHHRRRMGLPANHTGLADANAARRVKQRLKQGGQGWWHLLPNADSGDEGWQLWNTECMVLSLLRDRGPLTRGELLGELGRRRLLGPDGRAIFSRLIESKLVEVHQPQAGQTVFVLSERAILPEPAREPLYG